MLPTLTALEPRRGAYEAPLLGAAIIYRELTRAEYLASQDQAAHTFERGGARWLTDMGVSCRTADIVAAGCIDPESGAPLWTGMAVLSWPRRVWPDVEELERRILSLSEVGADALTKSDPADDAGGAAGPG